MTRKQFASLVSEARHHVPLKELEESGSLDGLALHKERVVCTKNGCISFIRWHALCFDGSWDTNMLNELAFLFKRVELIT